LTVDNQDVDIERRAAFLDRIIFFGRASHRRLS
jgi:hypothetical protein